MHKYTYLPKPYNFCRKLAVICVVFRYNREATILNDINVKAQSCEAYHESGHEGWTFFVQKKFRKNDTTNKAEQKI